MGNPPTINSKVSRASVASDFHGERAGPEPEKAALFGGAENSFEALHAPPVDPVSAANVPLLFRFPDQVGTAQAHHAGNLVRGIRHPPNIRHTLDFTIVGNISGHAFTHFEVSQGRVFLTTLSGQPVQIVSFDVKTGAVSSLNPTTRTFFTCNSVPTDRGIAIAWNYRDNEDSGKCIAHIDADTNEVLWSTPLSATGTESIEFIKQTRSGDILALTTSRIDDSHCTGWLWRLDGKTGKTQNGPCTLNLNNIVNRAPSFFFYSEHKESIIVGRDGNKLHAIDAATATVRAVTDLPDLYKGFTRVRLRQDQMLFVPDFFATEREKGYRVTLEVNGEIKLDSITTKETGTSSASFVTNCNATIAVREASDGAFSFFRITDEAFELIKTLTLEGSPKGTKRGVPNSFIAMTSDEVVYYSRVMKQDEDELACDCRLYAFDARTQEELWHIDRAFDAPPTLVVNDDGSLSWVGGATGVILEE